MVNTSGDGMGEVQYRPLQADDAVALQDLHAHLSDETVRRRFLGMHRELSEVEAHRFADVDHLGREAIAAVHGNEVIGVARYEQTAVDTAEVAVVVRDDYQRQGHGTRMMQILLDRARHADIRYFKLERLADNNAVVALIGRLGLERSRVSITRYGVTAETVRIPDM